MIEPIIPPEDNARYALLLTDYVQPINASRGEPVPTCHFTAMEFHECDSDPSGRNDGYQCRHCGHTESSFEAWAKVEARNQGQTTLGPGPI